jgi:hypothetical protein
MGHEGGGKVYLGGVDDEAERGGLDRLESGASRRSGESGGDGDQRKGKAHHRQQRNATHVGEVVVVNPSGAKRGQQQHRSWRGHTKPQENEAATSKPPMHIDPDWSQHGIRRDISRELQIGSLQRKYVGNCIFFCHKVKIKEIAT